MNNNPNIIQFGSDYDANNSDELVPEEELSLQEPPLMDLIEERENQILNENNILIPEQNMEAPIINEENHKLFDIPTNKFSEKYFHPPIFKKLGKYYNERRRDNKDLMRKRIKSNFYKKMRNKLNMKISALNIKEKFEWPQNLVINTTKSKNRKDLNTSLEQLLLENNILIYQNHRDILQAIKFDCMFEAKIKILFNEYTDSEQFQSVVKKWIDEEESYEYIYNYIIISKKYIKYLNKENNKDN